MQRDVKIGIAIGVLLIALVAIFMWTRHDATQPLMPAEGEDLRAQLPPAQEPVASLGLSAEEDLLGAPTFSAAEVPMPTPPGSDIDTSSLESPAGAPIPATPTLQETPAEAPVHVSQPTTAPKQHIVASGENLSRIAALYYGTSSTANISRIYDANKSVIGADRNKLRVGMKLTIPDVSTSTTLVPVTINSSSTTASEAKTHKVAKGEVLSKIAARYYGTGNKANIDRIYNANKSVIGSDPNKLKVGMVLTIPATD